MYWVCEIMFVSTMTGVEKYWNLNLKLFFTEGQKSIKINQFR